MSTLREKVARAMCPDHTDPDTPVRLHDGNWIAFWTLMLPKADAAIPLVVEACAKELLICYGNSIYTNNVIARIRALSAPGPQP